jgi:hypothetical protein
MVGGGNSNTMFVPLVLAEKKKICSYLLIGKTPYLRDVLKI